MSGKNSNLFLTTKSTTKTSAKSKPLVVVKKKAQKDIKKTDDSDKDESVVESTESSVEEKELSKKPTKKKTPKKSQRTTMYLNSDSAKPVTAAGALIYKKIGKNMMVLVIESNAQYEDIGGKIDPEDADIASAAAREIEEETNGQIKSDDVIDRLNSASYIYVPKSKYLIYLIEASDKEKKLKRSDFGDREEHDGYDRVIGWISREELAKPATIHKLNWRMRSKALFEKLADIEKNSKLKKNLFGNKSKTDSESKKKSESDTESDTVSNTESETESVSE
jgi:8-oxo-dGTP pyrophosphatase MutT (NUDIX family)